MTLPVRRFSPDHLHPDEAFEQWRTLLGPLYRLTRAGGARPPPTGELTAFLLGDVIANRTVFQAQRVTRDRKLVGATPDHVVLQYWRSGGYDGEIAGRPISYGGGQIRFVDCRQTLAGRFVASESLGFVIPRSLISGIDPGRMAPLLDGRRNRLAAAKISALYRRLPRLEAADAAAVTADLLAFLRRLFDPSRAADVLGGAEFDDGLLHLAEQIVLRHLGSDALTPDFLAGQLGVSRATLYRIFAPLGGVMRYVFGQRLLEVRRRLGDPGEQRSLVRLAEDHGFSSAVLLSRTFRARFGLSPRQWRQQQAGRRGAAVAAGAAADAEELWWSQLGGAR